MNWKITQRLAFPLFILLVSLSGCASFNPQPQATQSFQQRKMSKTNGDVSVSIAVLSPKESQTVFGLDLAKKNIQPIWLEIDNRGDAPFLLMPILIDHDYYAPLEVAYKFRRRFSKKKTRRQDDYFNRMHMPHYIPSNTVSTGYVYGRMEAGIRYAKIVMLQEHAELLELSFAVPVPGIQADFHRVDFETLYTEDELIHIDDPSELRKALAELPRCTMDKKGKKEGDPLNLVVIGSIESFVPSFSERNWDITEVIRLGTMFKTIKAFFIGSKYQFSPVSSLYVFDRPQDAAFQKIRGTIHERNHLRLWVSPIVYRGKPVSIGQISRDIGVRFTTRTLVTHKIDPDVDAARLYFAQDMLLTRTVESIGYVAGVEKAPRDAPRKNLCGDPYFTDGTRLVIVFSEENVHLEDMELFDWEAIPLH